MQKKNRGLENRATKNKNNLTQRKELPLIGQLKMQEGQILKLRGPHKHYQLTFALHLELLSRFYALSSICNKRS